MEKREPCSETLGTNPYLIYINIYIYIYDRYVYVICIYSYIFFVPKKVDKIFQKQL